MDGDTCIAGEPVGRSDVRLVRTIDEPGRATGWNRVEDSNMGEKLSCDFAADCNGRAMVEPNAEQADKAFRNGFCEPDPVFATTDPGWQLLAQPDDRYGKPEFLEPFDCLREVGHPVVGEPVGGDDEDMIESFVGLFGSKGEFSGKMGRTSERTADSA